MLGAGLYLAVLGLLALIGRTKFTPQGLHLLPPWAGFAVVCAYAAAALVAAASTLSRWDA